MRKTTVTSTDGYYAMTADGESVRCMGDKILHPGQVIRTDGKYAYGHLLSGGGSYIPSTGYVIPIIDDSNMLYYWDCDTEKLVTVGQTNVDCYEYHLINNEHDFFLVKGYDWQDIDITHYGKDKSDPDDKASKVYKVLRGGYSYYRDIEWGRNQLFSGGSETDYTDGCDVYDYEQSNTDEMYPENNSSSSKHTIAHNDPPPGGFSTAPKKDVVDESGDPMTIYCDDAVIVSVDMKSYCDEAESVWQQAVREASNKYNNGEAYPDWRSTPPDPIITSKGASPSSIRIDNEGNWTAIISVNCYGFFFPWKNFERVHKKKSISDISCSSGRFARYVDLPLQKPYYIYYTDLIVDNYSTYVSNELQLKKSWQMYSCSVSTTLLIDSKGNCEKLSEFIDFSQAHNDYPDWGQADYSPGVGVFINNITKKCSGWTGIMPDYTVIDRQYVNKSSDAIPFRNVSDMKNQQFDNKRGDSIDMYMFPAQDNFIERISRNESTIYQNGKSIISYYFGNSPIAAIEYKPGKYLVAEQHNAVWRVVPSKGIKEELGPYSMNFRFNKLSKLRLNKLIEFLGIDTKIPGGSPGTDPGGGGDNPPPF